MVLLFFKSKERENYYLIYKGNNGVDIQRMLRLVTNTGEFENSGYDKVEVELGYVLKTDLNRGFLEFIVENIATNYIPHPWYNSENFNAWHEFKKYEPEKWITQFNAYKIWKITELAKSNQKGKQATLF
jgi:hypothetical protein